MLRDAELMGFVATTDAERAKAFYRDTLGLRLVADESYALVFDANGTTLRIQKVQQAVVAPYTTLGWKVTDITTTVRDLARRGLTFERYPGVDQNGDGIWSSPAGVRVAWFKDPDGNTLSVTQL